MPTLSLKANERPSLLRRGNFVSYGGGYAILVGYPAVASAEERAKGLSLSHIKGIILVDCYLNQF